jgi:hypothetical protein
LSRSCAMVVLVAARASFLRSPAITAACPR